MPRPRTLVRLEMEAVQGPQALTVLAVSGLRERVDLTRKGMMLEQDLLKW